MHSSSPPPRCAACPFKREERLCCVPGGKHPPDCPSAAHTDLVEKSRRTYAQPDIRHFARQAARVERHSYAKLPDGGRMPCRPRILEIVAFARAMGYHRLGLLFCIGLRREAAGAAEIFEARRAGRPRASWASRARICSTRSSRKACAIPCSRPS